MKAEGGEASTITPPCASQPTVSSSPKGRRFPLSSRFHQNAQNTWNSPRLSTQRRRRSGPRATSPTQSPPSEGASPSHLPAVYPDAPAVPHQSNNSLSREIYDAVVLGCLFRC